MAEVEHIQDEGLREKVIEVWALAIAQSSFRSIWDIPPAGNPGFMALTRGDQTDHIRGMTRLAMTIANEMAESNRDLDISRDTVIAGGLCHNVGKPWGFDPENRKR